MKKRPGPNMITVGTHRIFPVLVLPFITSARVSQAASQLTQFITFLLPPITAHTEKSQERQGISRLLRKNKVARRVFIWSGTAVCAMFGLGLVFLSTGLIPVIPLDGSVTGLGYDGHNRTGILAEINAKSD